MAVGSQEDERRRVSHPLSPWRMRGALRFVLFTAYCLLPTAYCLQASAQKRPKPALKEKAAREAVAATPGFSLRTGAVKVREVSPAGASPVAVAADVTLAVRFESVEDERVPQTGGVFKVKRWRAVEFRTGDRTWEEFDLIAPAFGVGTVEAVRLALEELVAEFAARQSQVKAVDADAAEVQGEESKNDSKKDKGSEKGKSSKKDKDSKKEEAEKAAEPLTRGPLTIKALSPMGSSAVAEIVVAADFNLTKDARGRWRVESVAVGGGSLADLTPRWRLADARKVERVREDLAALGSALEAFRQERGFYVVAKDSTTLLDHLSPRYTSRIVRLDPWHNPYRYAGTQASYTLGSDGPDGKQGTADDLTATRPSSLPTRVVYD